ncbi:MAG TPA: tRNA (guanosine(37)-N1)-methyltransferase TrmD [Clostridiales bacterium]|jgi:tRNA (guanine37-N1)-methyltransferase|nr:tRNA (guanosine(37)-N1)-methyltransferase TrmD [Clostridiales bacterium]
MNFHVLTLFPEMIETCINTSITGRAIESGLITLNTVNIRDFSDDKHKRVDDYPYGGGAGMIIQAEPVYKAYGYLVNHIKLSKEDQSLYKKPRVIYVTPQGHVFNQNMAYELSQEEDLIFLCGHYEGIDERVLEMIVTDNISIGDYILTGGELPAMVMIDAIARLIPGVLSNEASAEFESFKDNLLEYPQYTRPEMFMGRRVPEVLLSGHHAKIEEFRRQQAIARTYERRPDLLENAVLTEEEREYLTRLIFQKNFDVYS